jgi:hypothetical protein
MTIQTVCPRCRTTLEVDAQDAHEQVVCGSCGKVFVPALADDRLAPPRLRDDEDDRPRRPPRSRWDDEDEDRPRRRRSRYDDEDEWDDRPRRRRRRDDGSGYATTSLALGVVSCLIFLCSPVGFCTSLAGVLTGYAGLRSRLRPLAVTGLVLSLVGMTFAVGFTLLYLTGALQAGQNPAGPNGLKEDRQRF